jgi:dienelactone hydrolase
MIGRMKPIVKKMKYLIVFTLSMALLVLASKNAWAAETVVDEAVSARSTPDGVEFAVLELPQAKPAPTLIVLSGVARDTLSKSSFLQAGRFLRSQGYLIVSIDLPCHGTQETKGAKGLSGWGKRAAAGDDFVAEFNARMTKVLDHLIAERLTDPNKIAVCGTSRGGFLAMRFAAVDKRVKCAAGYSPVTDLRQLSEFRNAATVAGVDAMSLEAHVNELVGRPVFLVIGDRDERVGTDAAVRFARALSAAASKANVPSGVELHVVSEPRGNHTTPTGGDIWSARWIFRVLEARELPE